MNHIQEHQEARNARMRQLYGVESPQQIVEKTATIITKADFETQHPKEEYEIYTIGDIHSFRMDLMKAEGAKDEDFVNATKDLKHFLVTHEGEKRIAFTRKKVAEQK